MKLITDKLRERRKEYSIPGLPYLPKGKCVLIYRLPSETRTAGGLIIPEDAEEAKPMGVLLAAGLGAMDELRDALIEIGDIVWFARYAGWEKEVERDPMNKGRHILQADSKEILGSVDALDRVYGSTATHAVWFDEDGPDATEKHWYVTKESRNGH